jgi:hypothetical protein
MDTPHVQREAESCIACTTSVKVSSVLTVSLTDCDVYVPDRQDVMKVPVLGVIND